MTYFSGFSCLLGLTILLLQTIFVSKKAVNNEKWKAQNNSFDSFDRGQKNKRLTEREARLTLKMGVSGFQVQDTHNASCFTNMTWIGLNLSDWEVTQNI